MSDFLHPDLTLFVACHQFIAGTFVSLEAANYGHGEFKDVEFVQLAMRRRGDTTDLFHGYNSKVRNAISHAGSHGVTVEGRSVLFRDIKLSPPARCLNVRWSVDELGWNGILMAELINCIDAATEIFGLDCVNPDDVDFSTLLQVIDAAFTPEQQSEITAQLQASIETVWHNPELSDNRRREILATILTENYQKRNMALRGVDLSGNKTTVLIAVPPEGTLDDEQGVRIRLVELTRYLILARTGFGLFGERIAVAETDEKIQRHRLLATVPSTLLDEYAGKKAGIINGLRGGSFSLEGHRLEVKVNEQALAEMEDQSLGRSFPRRGRSSPSGP